MVNNRAVGDELETMISNDLKINKTTNSGAMFNNGDLSNAKIIIEAKVKNDKKKFTVDPKELSKLRRQADDRFKDWAYIQKTQDGTQVLVDYDLFVELYNSYQALIQLRNSL